MLSTKAKESMGFLFPVLNRLRLAWLKVKLSGKGVLCVCCNSQFRSFAPFGTVRRENAWCPQCESLERHRMLWMFLRERTSVFAEPTRLLHVAPETIFFKQFVHQSHIEYYPADKFNNLYPEGTAFIDLLAINYPDAHFDAIICNHVFQYIEEDRVAMRELHRVLKPGGWAILQVPIGRHLNQTYEDATITNPIDREKAFGLKDHVRFYAMDYVQRLQEEGFMVQAEDYSSQFSAEEIHRYGFLKGDPIFFCKK